MGKKLARAVVVGGVLHLPGQDAPDGVDNPKAFEEPHLSPREQWQAEQEAAEAEKPARGRAAAK